MSSDKGGGPVSTTGKTDPASTDQLTGIGRTFSSSAKNKARTNRYQRDYRGTHSCKSTLPFRDSKLTQQTDHPYPPHRSAVSMNRGYGHEAEEPKQELDNDSISRKDEEEDIGTFELDFNSSQSRLTDGKGQDGVAL